MKAADDGLVEIKAALDRMKTLAKDAKSTKYSDVERQIFNLEFGLKRDEITDIVNRTKVKGTKLLDGGGGAELSLEVGLEMRAVENGKLERGHDRIPPRLAASQRRTRPIQRHHGIVVSRGEKKA